MYSLGGIPVRYFGVCFEYLERHVSAASFRLECKISSKHQSQFQNHNPLPLENPLHFRVGNKRAPMWRGADIASQVVNDHNDVKKME